MSSKRTNEVHELATTIRDDLPILVRHGGAGPGDWFFEAPQVLRKIKRYDLGPPDHAVPPEALVADALAKACASLPDSHGTALRILLGLESPSRGEKLGVRRERAASVLGVTPETFRVHRERGLLDELAQATALALLEHRIGDDSLLEPSAPDPTQVLILHSRLSPGVGEVSRLVESLGLRPLTWTEALERAGLSSPSVVDRLRTCLATAQAVVIVLEGEAGESTDNLLFEVGIALGLADRRAVVVQLGEGLLPADLRDINVIRLRDTFESLEVFRLALRDAGCRVGARANPTTPSTDIAPGWYRWTPARAARPSYSAIARAVEEFVPLGLEAGFRAAEWLKTEALDDHGATVTYVLADNGRVDGFIAVASTQIELLERDFEAFDLPVTAGSSRARGATLLRWLARHQESPAGTGRKLFRFASAIAKEVAERQGSIGLLVEPFNEMESEVWQERYGLRHLGRSGGRPKLWLPLVGLDERSEADPAVLSRRS
jgi:hypothetical protein